MQAELIYFKPSGKYYSEGTMEIGNSHLFEVWEIVRQHMKAQTLPGLMQGHSHFTVLVNVPGHQHEHPKLLLPEGES